MGTGYLIRVVLFCLLIVDYTTVSAQNCDEIFLNQLEQKYHRKKTHFIKQVRNAAISPKVVNPPDLQTLPEDSIILICKVFFTKKQLKILTMEKSINPSFCVISILNP